MKRIDLTGQRFGRLTVIRYDHSEHDGVHWLCKCDCGNEKVAAGYSLRSGQTRSCGCLANEVRAARAEHMRQGRKPKKAPVEVRKPKSEKTATVRKVYPTRTAAEFFRFSKAHGCSVCADRKDCDMTFCKYEKELTS
jgi:hypothetical protein